MAECFCGCGRKVGFTGRGANKQGRRTTETVAQLQAALDQLEERKDETIAEIGQQAAQDYEDVLQFTRELLQIGEQYRVDWHHVLHSGFIPPEGARAFKRNWLGWGKVARGLKPMSDSSWSAFVMGLRAEYQEPAS